MRDSYRKTINYFMLGHKRQTLLVDITKLLVLETVLLLTKQDFVQKLSVGLEREFIESIYGISKTVPNYFLFCV